jgi:hypothetical protein
VKADLQLFLTGYTAISQQHQAAIKNFKEKSQDQEKLRLLTTGAMLFCEGSLIVKFWLTPEKIDLFFDVSAMRLRHSKAEPSDPVIISLLPDEIKLIDLDYSFEDKWEVGNHKTKDAVYFLAIPAL